MIKFVQYLRPNGERRDAKMERSPEIQELYGELADAGCDFEIELLLTGEVHMDVSILAPEEKGFDILPPGSRPNEVVILANAVVPNGPGMKEEVDDLIRRAYRWLSKGTAA